MNKILILLLFTLVACNRSAPSLYGESKTRAVDSTNINVDSAASESTLPMDELSSFFDKQKMKDGFLIQPKNIKTDGDEIYCYFHLKENKATTLRLRMQFWKTASSSDYYSFDIDGEVIVYNANRSKSESGNGRVVENAVFNWYDNGINQEDLKFLQAISKAKTVKLTLISSSTNKVLNEIIISENNKTSIGQILEYYFALDGVKIPKKGMVNIRG